MRSLHLGDLSGGGDDNSGSGGDLGSSTSVSSASGEIAGFGSVIVNGIEFTRKPGLADDRVKLLFSNFSGAGEDRLRKLGQLRAERDRSQSQGFI